MSFKKPNSPKKSPIDRKQDKRSSKKDDSSMSSPGMDPSATLSKLDSNSIDRSKDSQTDATSDSVVAELRAESRELILGGYTVDKRPEKMDKIVPKGEFQFPTEPEEDVETFGGKKKEKKREAKGVNLMVQRVREWDENGLSSAAKKGASETKKQPVKRVRSETDLFGEAKMSKDTGDGSKDVVSKEGPDDLDASEASEDSDYEGHSPAEDGRRGGRKFGKRRSKGGTKTAVITLKIKPAAAELTAENADIRLRTNHTSTDRTERATTSTTVTAEESSAVFTTGPIVIGSSNNGEDEALARQLERQFEQIQKDQRTSPTNSPPPSLSKSDAKATSAGLNALLGPPLPIEASLRNPMEASLSISLSETSSGKTKTVKRVAGKFEGRPGTCTRPRSSTSGQASPYAVGQSKSTQRSSNTALSQWFAYATRATRFSAASGSGERKLCSHCNAMHCEYCSCRPILVAIIMICIGICLYLKYHRPNQ